MEDNIKSIASKCIKCNKPECSNYCPLSTKIPEILEYLNKNNEIDAAKLLFENNPFPFITGALCDVKRKCYGHCILNKKNIPIEYYKVEEELGNKYLDLSLMKPIQLKESKVAIIGGGIAGLTVAKRLIENGYKPNIYEKKNNLGGVIINSLPSFRYNKKNIRKVISYIIDNSNIYYNKSFGDNLLIDELMDYDYIVLTYGAGIERKNFKESVNAIYILEHTSEYDLLHDKDIVVIGGGNTAIDVARYLKKKNNVIIAYRRNFANAPASQNEIKKMINEEVFYLECVAPHKILTFEDKVYGIELEQMELYYDGSDRLNFRPTNLYFKAPCDMVVEATGSLCDYKYLKEILPEIFDDKGWIKETNNFMVSNNIYIGGDLYYGPKDFSSAIYSAEQIVKDILNKLK